MTKVEMIYLDLDGVIADFERGYTEKFNLNLAQVRSDKQFYKYFDTFINEGGFADLHLMPDAMDLLDHLKTLDVRIEILSSTARPENHVRIAPQKDLWLNKHGITYKRTFVPGKRHKCIYATPKSLIIDDTASVIQDWNDSGGIGILHTDADSTIEKLKPYV